MLELARNKSLVRMIQALNSNELGAQDVSGGCVYRDNEGRKCIIGCLLSDDFLDELSLKNMLHLDYSALVGQYPDLVSRTGLLPNQGMALQVWHDEATTYRWEGVFQKERLIEQLQEMLLGRRAFVTHPELK